MKQLNREAVRQPVFDVRRVTEGLNHQRGHGAADSALGNVRLPPSISITLTSRQGLLPLTLRSSATAPVRVQLVLTSDQLSSWPPRSQKAPPRPATRKKLREVPADAEPVDRLAAHTGGSTDAGAFPLTLQIERRPAIWSFGAAPVR